MYASARLASERGSRSYGLPSPGSRTSQVRISVGSSKNGSMLAVAGSGISSMSDASMPFQPAIDEPSKAWPPLNLSSSKCDTGTVTCCSLPRVSVNRKSTNLTSFSCTNFITSATVLDILGLLICGGATWPVHGPANSTVCRGNKADSVPRFGARRLGAFAGGSTETVHCSDAAGFAHLFDAHDAPNQTA